MFWAGHGLYRPSAVQAIFCTGHGLIRLDFASNGLVLQLAGLAMGSDVYGLGWTGLGLDCSCAVLATDWDSDGLDSYRSGKDVRWNGHRLGWAWAGLALVIVWAGHELACPCSGMAIGGAVLGMFWAVLALSWAGHGQFRTWFGPAMGGACHGLGRPWNGPALCRILLGLGVTWAVPAMGWVGHDLGRKWTGRKLYWTWAGPSVGKCGQGCADRRLGRI
jgi:hypothetical protein